MRNKKTRRKNLWLEKDIKHAGVLSSIIIAVGLGYLVVHFASASTCTISATLVNSCRPWFGAAVGGDPRAASDKISQFDYLEQEVGRQLDIFHDYDQATSPPLNSDEIHFIDRANTYAYVNWKPADNWADADGGDASVNATIQEAAESIKSVAPHKIFLTVWHEPENDVSGGTSCAIKPGTAGTPAQYIAMWQNVRNIFNQEGVNNVVWVMNYMGYYKWDCLIPQLWPGNSLVDWVTFDAYGTDSTPNWTGTVGRMYGVLEADESATTDFESKPWGVAEFGTCTMTNEQNAYGYFQDAKQAIDENLYPRLKLYMIYDDTGNNAGPGCLTDSSISGTYDPTKQNYFNDLADDSVFTVQSESTPTPILTPSSTPKPSATPGTTASTKTSPAPTPSRSSSPIINSSGGGSSGNSGSGSGTIDLTSGGLAAKVSIDGATVSGGSLNTDYLTNGVHKVTETVDGKTVQKVIKVNNKLNPFQAFRNYLFARFVGHPMVMNMGTIIVLILPLVAVAYLFKKLLASWFLDLLTRYRLSW